MKYRNLNSSFVIFSIPIYCLKDQANTYTKDSLVNFTSGWKHPEQGKEFITLWKES